MTIFTKIMLKQKINMFFSTKKNNKIFPKSEYLLQFHGCSKGNPGKSGAGAVIYNYGKEIWSKSIFVGNKNTNNEAEYNGLIIGLTTAKNMGIKNLNVEGDSLLVIKQMRGEYNVKSNNLLELYQQAKELANQFEYIEFNHIYRNNNKRADELSNSII
jgi:ribonuclease HI